MNDQQVIVAHHNPIAQTPVESPATDLEAVRAAHQKIYDVAHAALAKVAGTDAAEELKKRTQRGGQ